MLRPPFGEWNKNTVKSARTVAFLLMLNLGVFAAILAWLVRTQLLPGLAWGEAGTAVMAGASARLSSGGPDSAAAAAARARLGPRAGTNQFHWSQLESEDYKTYISRLRSIGCPDQTIRDIIIADLDKLMAPEIRKAYGRRPELQYWHPEEEEMLNDVNPRELQKREREVDERKRQIIRELVQADVIQERMRSTGKEDYYERRLTFLPEQKRSTVRELLEKYDEAERQVREKDEADGGNMGVADQTELSRLRRQRAAELDQALSPPEKQQYELWASPVANQVRHATYGMNASEQEFLAVYQARKAFEETWGGVQPELLEPAERVRMELARTTMNTQIRSHLGDDRYAEYQRGEDDDYHMLNALVTRFNLPREKAAEVYSYKAVAMGYRSQVQADPQLNPEQREVALKAIADETRGSVRSVLGAKAYSHYIRSGQARWIEE